MFFVTHATVHDEYYEYNDEYLLIILVVFICLSKLKRLKIRTTRYFDC